MDAAIDVTDDDLVAAIELPEAIYRTVTARLDGRPLQPADVDPLNERASGAAAHPTITAHRRHPPRRHPIATAGGLFASWTRRREPPGARFGHNGAVSSPARGRVLST